jgi:hypothetical protein
MVHSIEHDPIWFKHVSDQLSRVPGHAAAIHLRSTDPEEEPSRSPYVGAIDGLASHEFTVIVVDGEHRAACALAAVDRLGEGGVLVLDDAHWFLDHATTSPHSRRNRGHLDRGWVEFATRVDRWRSIWLSDGVTDTAIWIRPADSPSG